VIILSLPLFPLSSLGEIYKWTDEKGTVHFAEDPSKISREGLSGQQQFIQPAPPSLSTRFNKIEEDLRLSRNHRSKEPLQGLKNYKERSGNNLFYFIGLLIIIGILLMLFREKKPVRIGVRTGSQGSPGQRKNTVLFNVCCKDYSTDSTVVLGKIIERRIQPDSIPLKVESPSYRRRDTYLSKKPIEFMGFLATHIGEIITPSTKKITPPMRKMKPSNSSPAIRT
jgi:hypothetical protein